MPRIDCSVNNCSHNQSGVCYSNRVNMAGSFAHSSEGTCCGSFLDKAGYSTLTSNTNSSGACDCLVCEATSCTHNNNKLCSADTITVSGNGANLYSETNCETFRCK